MKTGEPRLEIKRKDEHQHSHRTKPWDDSLGPRVTDKTQTHATVKFLHVCHCGDKVVENVRTLIT